jgi:hypothetical protein
MVPVKQIRVRNRICVRQVDELTTCDDDDAWKRSTLGGVLRF